jgi:hypothetical protein
MVDRVENEPKATRKDKIGCLLTGLGIIAVLAPVGYGAYWAIERINIDKNNAIKVEQGILQENGVPGMHALILLNQTGKPDLKDTEGYFKYVNMLNDKGKKVPGVEFAWKRADGEEIVSTVFLNKTKATLDNQGSDVTFDIKAEDCLTDELFSHAITSVDPNKYVFRSESIIFSLSGQDLKNFKGPK